MSAAHVSSHSSSVRAVIQKKEYKIYEHFNMQAVLIINRHKYIYPKYPLLRCSRYHESHKKFN